jgi:hypothetical protein
LKSIVEIDPSLRTLPAVVVVVAEVEQAVRPSSAAVAVAALVRSASIDHSEM